MASFTNDSDASSQRGEWLELTLPKQFSRLLYTNPVCFLSTSSQDHGRNVMVVSWMTAINNEGRLVMSLCRRRHTASLLLSQEYTTTFVLSVPIQGMEDLVRQVGGQSGRWGCKLNPLGRRPSNDEGKATGMVTDDTTAISSTAMSTYVPSRKRRKNNLGKQDQTWIPDLIALPLGGKTKDVDHFSQSHEDFAIQGTVAHIQCNILSIQTADSKLNNLSSAETVDDDHILVFGQVTKAYVHEQYWDTTKNLFRRQSETVAPYLTFFGSQTFGYVV
jgi:flavin reductase (DIM6/NTAB) family NADH-FMN oxidoreductase RutF